MARKTNKTAHVLNLISKAKEEHQTAEDNLEINSVNNNITSDLSFINTEISNDKELGEKIKENLSKTVEAEISADLADDISDSEKAKEEKTIDTNNDLDKTPLNESSNADECFTSENQDADDLKDNIDFSYVNVLEEVVKLRVDEFIEMFGVCSCPRCKADVIALALNNLPPKYIVVDSSHVSPLLNFFSNHYSGAVAAQLSRACTVVRENPHHKI